MKALLYCTKGKPYITWGNNKKCYPSCACSDGIRSWHLNGKIVAEVEIDKVDFYEIEYYKKDLVLNQISIYDELESKEWGHDCFKRVISNENTDEEIANCSLLKKSCLTFEELGSYVCPKEGINNFYALHLTNLKVFDKPKELSEYSKRLPSGDFQQLGKAPQNMMKVCEIKYLIEDYVLISIQPQHLCKILNGKKTIEIRRKVLNCLKEGL